jgi:uncharacterized membrane protein required for colicin V production
MNHLPDINVIDIAAVIVVCVSLIIGIRRGLSGELAGLIGTIAAFGLGAHFLAPFGVWLQAHTRLGERPAQALAFISVAVGVIIVMILLRLLLGKIMKISFEPAVDKFGGFASGLIRSCVLVLIIFVSIQMCPNDYLNRKFGEESVVGRFVAKHVMPRVEDKKPVEELKTEATSAVEKLDGKIKKP